MSSQVPQGGIPYLEPCANETSNGPWGLASLSLPWRYLLPRPKQDTDPLSSLLFGLINVADTINMLPPGIPSSG